MSSERTKSKNKSGAVAPAPTKNTHFKVKNINGTSKDPYSNSKSKTSKSWLDVWRDETKSDRKTCCVLKCSDDAEVGAHVMLVDGRMHNDWYLAPFCKGHNHYSNDQEMFIDSRVSLVTVRTDML